MGNNVPVVDAVTGVGARMTYDRGLGYAQLAAEKIDFQFSRGEVVGFVCDRFDLLSDFPPTGDAKQTVDFDNALRRQYTILHYGLIFIPTTGSSCLLKAVLAFQQLLLLSLNRPDKKYVADAADTLLEIYREMEKRTQRPYQINPALNNGAMFRPFSPKILSLFPLDKYEFWKKQSKVQPVKGTASTKNDGLIPIVEKQDKAVKEMDLDEALDKAMKIADADEKIKAALNQQLGGVTPLVNDYRANLTMLTLVDVFNQTNQVIQNKADFTLSAMIDYIYYVSYITLILDKNGEPVGGDGVHGLFQYGMILPSLNFKTVRFIPPQGKYVSLGPMATQAFSIKGGIIKKLPISYAGILSYQEVDVTGQWAPDYLEQANERFSLYREYIGALVTDGAFSPKEINLSDIVSGLVDIVEESMPYLLVVIKKKAENWFENYQDLLKEMAEAILKQLIITEVQAIAKKYIIKKIGKRIIPLLNLVAAASDLINLARGKDTIRDTVAVSCIRLYLKGGRSDDKTLSLKILGNVMGDEFEDQLKAVIVNQAVKHGVKLKNKVVNARIKPVLPAKPLEQQTSPEEPVKPPTPPDATAVKPNNSAEQQQMSQKLLEAYQNATAPSDPRATADKGKAPPFDPKAPTNTKTSGTAGSKTEREDKENDRELLSNRGKQSEVEDGKGGKKQTVGKKGLDDDTEDDGAKGKKPSNKKQETNREEEIADEVSGKTKKSTHIDIPIETSRRKFRSRLKKLLRDNPKHPLRALYNPLTDNLHPSVGPGLDIDYWYAYPEAIQAGHLNSKVGGGPELIVIMSASENQNLNHTIESRGNVMNYAEKKIAIVEGVPISVETLTHLIDKGKVAQFALDTAKILPADEFIRIAIKQ